MTDKFPRPGGGDGDGLAESATERLLREAMSARASMITAYDLRPAAPPKTRVRRLRPVYLTTAPILALAASVAIGVFAFHGDPVAKQDVPPPPAASITTFPSPTATPTATATPTSTATPTDTGTPTGGAATDVPLADVTPASTPTAAGTPTGPATSYTLRGVRFKVPAGWKVASSKAVDNQVCVLSPGAPTGPQQNWSPDSCAPYGVWVVVYNTPGEVTGGAWPTVSDMDSPSGWSHQGSCPIWGNPHTPASGEETSTGPNKSTTTMAGRSGVKSQWQGSCGKDAFTAQMWSLPKDQVFVVAAGLKDDYQSGLASIVGSIDASGHQAMADNTPDANRSEIAVTFDGLADGQQLTAGSSVVTFSVTFRNTGQNTYSQLQALVTTDVYPGSPTAGPGAQEPSKLERQDNGAWKQVAMSPGAGMDYAVADPALFSFAPGQSRTVTYRMTLGAGNGPGNMPVKAQLVLPHDGSKPTLIGEKDVTVKVTK
ncbi:hypothetical protein ACH4E7_04430 [Kitasatospora sp. NPDC018058]|uniref:hypothetical protein n=1 Tax=Kitasatospora sp. NPDC018058 TaxID=3364025 RepID=UPI0037C1A321